MLGHLGITWITMMRSLLFTQNDEQITKSYRIASFHKTFPTFKIQFKIWSQMIPEWFSGWWLTYPSEKYLFVNGKDYPWLSPIYYGNIKNVETTNQVYSWIINGLIYIYIYPYNGISPWMIPQPGIISGIGSASGSASGGVETAAGASGSFSKPWMPGNSWKPEKIHGFSWSIFWGWRFCPIIFWGWRFFFQFGNKMEFVFNSIHGVYDHFTFGFCSNL